MAEYNRPESPLDRSAAAFPADYRRVLEASNLPVEVATAIADRLDVFSGPKCEPWIAAGERLPDQGQRVLIWDRDWEDFFISTNKGSQVWPVTRYTHWMPLPASPATGERP